MGEFAFLITALALVEAEANLRAIRCVVLDPLPFDFPLELDDFPFFPFPFGFHSPQFCCG